MDIGNVFQALVDNPALTIGSVVLIVIVVFTFLHDKGGKSSSGGGDGSGSVQS